MADEIVKKEDAPLDIFKQHLSETHNLFKDSMQNLSALLQQELTPTQLAVLHEWTSKSQATVKAFDENFRERLLIVLREQGTEVTAKGTLQIALDDGRVQRAVPTNTKPSDKLVENKLRSKKLDIKEWMREDVKYKVDEDKLKVLLARGLLTEQEYRDCFEERSYRVSKPQLKEEVDE